MSKLLINEPPLQVLPTLAVCIGLNEAIILQQIHYWLAMSSHEHDERKWIYNSYPSWQKQFPFWGLNTIRRGLSSLEEQGLIDTGNYNKDPRDQTKWYTINYSALDQLQIPSVEINRPSAQNGQATYPKWADQLPNMGRPLPETTTETTTENSLPISSAADEQPDRAQPKRKSILTTNAAKDAFQQFWDAYPKRNGYKGSRKDAEAEFARIPPDEWATVLSATQKYGRMCDPARPDARIPKDAERFLKADFWRSIADADEPGFRSTNGNGRHEPIGRVLHETTTEERAEREQRRDLPIPPRKVRLAG